MSKIKIFRKISMLFTLIFSFLFSVIAPGNVKALEAGDVYQQYATVSNIALDNNVLSFNLENNSDVDVTGVSDFTYKFTYWVEDVLIGELKQADDSFTKDGSKYLINLDESVVGVTLYKVRYKTSTSFITLDLNGVNSVGECDNTLKLNWVQLDKGEIVSTKSEVIYGGQDVNVQYSYNAFYFNFTDLVVDDVIDVDLRYYLYTNTYERQKILGFTVSEKSENTDPVEYEYDVSQTDSVYQGWEDENVITQLKCLYGNCSDSYQKYAIEKSDKESYQWKINLPTTTILSSTGMGHTWIQTEVIEQADITTISYIIDGKEFMDIPVYQESSGFVYMPEFNKKNSICDMIRSWFDSWVDIIVWIIVVLVVIFGASIIGFILKLFKLDKDSREKRRLRKDMRELREQQMEMIKAQQNNYSNEKKNSNKRYNNIKRYKK